MSRGPDWWTDWFIPLLIVSFVALIFKGGIFLTIMLWACYLTEGRKAVEAHPSEENQAEYGRNLVIGVIVIVLAIIIVISAKAD